MYLNFNPYPPSYGYNYSEIGLSCLTSGGKGLNFILQQLHMATNRLYVAQLFYICHAEELEVFGGGSVTTVLHRVQTNDGGDRHELCSTYVDNSVNDQDIQI